MKVHKRNIAGIKMFRSGSDKFSEYTSVNDLKRKYQYDKKHYKKNFVIPV